MPTAKKPANRAKVPLAQTGNISNALKTIASLPETLTVNIPDVQQLVGVSDVASPSSFDAAGWKRVTDEQRAEDEKHYKELQNWGRNLKDGIATVRVGVSAGIEAAKLGQDLVKYATAVEGIKTEGVNLDIQREKTAQAYVKRDKEYATTAHLGALNENQALAYQVELEKLAIQLGGKQAEAQMLAAEVKAKYPVIDVKAR